VTRPGCREKERRVKILAVGANPDDVEFLCAGTLALYSKAGNDVAIAYLTTGDKGTAERAPEEIAEIRAEEARRSAAIVGASLYPVGLPDGGVEPTFQLRRRLVEVIRLARPDVIITHSREDYMSDHYYTSQLVKDASFWAGSKGFAGDPGGAPACSIRPPIYSMDTLGGIGFVPQEYVDITAVMDVKEAMLSEHRSQLRYMKERDGLDLLDYMRTSARYRGYQCGVRYAEGYVPERYYPSLSPKRLLP
jgi:LmbE family N-acetylglucosaminyl deacetylase